MNKPESLRAHLLVAVPELRHSPDRLLVFIDKGKLRCTAAASLPWEYGYELQVFLTDFAGHPDAVMLTLLAWIWTNQSELLVNLDKSAQDIGFEADIVDNAKVDLAITLPLIGRVVVKRQPDDTYQLSHVPESLYTEYQEPATWQVFVGHELLAEWQSRSAGDALALETPQPDRSRG